MSVKLVFIWDHIKIMNVLHRRFLAGKTLFIKYIKYQCLIEIVVILANVCILMNASTQVTLSILDNVSDFELTCS